MTIPQFPHCDSSILHAPGECQFCDDHADWQELREWWRINFTGHDDCDKAPCPSAARRSDAGLSWHGNVPTNNPDWVTAKAPTVVHHRATGRWETLVEHHTTAPEGRQWAWWVFSRKGSTYLAGYSQTRQGAILASWWATHRGKARE